MAAAVVTTATTIEKQIVEVAAAIEALEKAAIAADTAGTFTPRLTLSTDVEAAEVTVSITLPAVVSGTGGTVSLVPEAYLV
jgi:hydroxymethylglutaryl-CoA reductase